MKANRDQVLRRLRRIEGQVRGLQRMVEEDRYCIDVLTQLTAVRAALAQVGVQVLDAHARGCLTAAVQSGQSEAAIDEFLDALERFMK